jgi:hypothetical protein
MRDEPRPAPRRGHSRRDRDDEGFRCPFCRTRRPPYQGRRVSTGGWILFAVLSLSCVGLLFSWVGLLLTEEYTICDECGVALGGRA